LVLPVLLYALKLRLFNKFNFDTLTKAFNTAINDSSSSSSSSSSSNCFGSLAYAIDKVVYSIGQGNMLTSIIVSTAMTYIIIAGFSIFQE
jgi:multisubunit Na+/H+ antiporter MnhC subunit